MKNLKRILVMLFAVSMLLWSLTLFSCGKEDDKDKEKAEETEGKEGTTNQELKFNNKVEEMYYNLARADSYTYEYEDADGEVNTEMVDFKNLVAYEIEKDADGNVTLEECYWLDKDENKYYYATLNDGIVEKRELERDDFLEVICDYVQNDNSAFLSKCVEIGYYAEKDGVFTLEREYNGTHYKIIYKVEKDALVSEYSRTTYNGKTELSAFKYYDINKTVVTIPEKFLSAEAELL